MGDDNGGVSHPLSRIQRVRCLGCGVVYVKPNGGGTVTANPGCPDCGYVGWVKDGEPFSRESFQLRSVADPRRRRTG
jgi:hypothetical protein